MGTPPNMPGKLMILVGLMGLGVIANLATGAVLGAVIGAALLFGVLVGNNGVRQFLRGLAALQLLFAVYVIAMASGRVDGGALAIVAFFGIGIPVYYIWCLGQDDVRDWMFRKNFNLDGVDDPPPSL